ncbi:MAG: caspase family protein [Anaerolineae bacterium]|nr:caspase family protein [Anaerolineae bacterium]
MAKKALCVGINDYPYDGSDLKGCVNDARAWAEMLVDHYGFASEDVTLLFDTEATKDKILSTLKDLIAGSGEGDVLVFTNSSHGTYLADTSGDEARYDQAMCPYDCAQNLIIDDELRELFTQLPAGVHLTVISDSCFSGTVTRVLLDENIPGLALPDERRVRFLDPSHRGDRVLPNPWRAKPKGREKYPESEMREVLLSGCNNKEYSYDARIGDTYHGAMTYHALQVIREADYDLTYAELHERMVPLIDEAGYPQHPQLEGRSENKDRPIFA